MTRQLLLCKRLFLEGCKFAHAPDPVSCGIAVLLFQDSVEMLVWALIKQFDISVNEKSGFLANLEALQKKPLALSGTARIYDLNKARIGFKHNGNLPAPEDAAKYQYSTEDFLRLAMSEHFETEFDELSLIDLVSFPDVRVRLKKADAFIKDGDIRGAIEEASISKSILFSKLDCYFPKMNHGIRGADQQISDALRPDRALSEGPTLRGRLRAFGDIADHLEYMQEMMLVSLLRISLDDYHFLNSTLLRAKETFGGTWILSAQANHDAVQNAEMCSRQISCLVDIGIRIQDHRPKE